MRWLRNYEGNFRSMKGKDQVHEAIAERDQLEQIEDEIKRWLGETTVSPSKGGASDRPSEADG